MANSSIGTAWIQIKPTTTGIKSTLQSDLNSAVGNVGETSGEKFSTGFAAKMGTVAGIASKVFGKLTDIVSSSFSAAIGRTDTLNNFSNVMGNLNIGAEDAQAAIDKMADKLTGLPTSLDDAASAVQRFTTKNEDVGKSTDMFLALNNALLAGGASMDIQANALEQISQAYAKGKPDMVEWRSILQAMPAQATQLGKAFGMSADELGEALRKGDISMDDFMNTVVKLNTEGVDGFKSFEEQAAAATNTLQTKMANVGNSITKVISAALNGDDLEKPINQLVDRIIDIAPQLIKGFTTAVLGLLQAIPKLIPPLVQSILEMAPSIFEGITQLIIGLVEMLPELIPIITSALPAIINGITSTLLAPETLSRIFQAAIELWLQLQLAWPDVLVAIIDALPDLIVSLVDFLTNPDNILKIVDAAVRLFMGIVEAVPQIIGALLGAFGNLFGKLWDTLQKNFGKFAADFGNFLGDVFKGAINGVLEFIEGFINAPIKLINKFIDLINSTFGVIGVNIGHIGLVSLPRMARGGIVAGYGTETSDDNLVALSKGEYVIRAAAAQDIGYSRLEEMNRTGEVESDRPNQVQIIINGYNKSPEELANIISRKIALKTQGVLA